MALHINAFVLLPVLAISLSGCASSIAPNPTAKNVHETLKDLTEKKRVCAVAVAVIKNRKLDSIHAETGCSPAPAVMADSVFQAASLSKPVFGYAVLKLVEQGKLALDAPVMNYLPQGYQHQFAPGIAEPSDRVTDARLHAVTVRMILNHTSGLPNWALGPLEFDADPGTKWQYSGEGYLLLQRAVEAVTGQPLDQFMATEVFKPLAMNNSDYVWSERIAPNLLPGTKANGALRSMPDMKSPVSAFSLYTSASDYGKFVAGVLNDDDLIKQITASPVTVDPSLGLSWGLGWGIERHGDDWYLWQWGNNPGYRAFVIASLRTGDGFVMLTNSENGLALAEPITRTILGGKHKLFQSSVLGTDVLNLLCTMMRLCL